MLGRSLRFPIGAAVALALFASSPASGQGLDQRLDAAEQQLDADTKACRPINIADYATLLNEASLNKKRAEKAAKSGLPIDEAKLNADLTRATVLLHRAQNALVQQCIRQATQPQTTPPAQTTGATPATSTSPPQGLSQASRDEIARQQRTIGEVETDIKKLAALVKARKCGEADYLADQLGFRFAELRDSPLRGVPGRLIDEWDRRIDALLDDCPLPVVRPQISTPSMPSPRHEVGSTPSMPSPRHEVARTMPRLNPFNQRILDLHNKERAALGLQPFYWNQSLADGAQAYADELARSGQLAHAPREGRGTVRENLNTGMRGWNADQMMANWLNEKNRLTPGIFPNVCAGDWYECAHYTQIIWVETTEIGCGKSETRIYVWLVCRYNPGGNKDGKPVGYMQTPQIAAATTVPESPVVLSGTVTDYAGNPVPGARVYVSERGIAGETLASTRTDSTGRYSFDSDQVPEEGFYTVLVDAGGGFGGLASQGAVEISQWTDPTQDFVVNPQDLGRSASLFDLGIYGGGAWTTDWFDDGGGADPQEDCLENYPFSGRFNRQVEAYLQPEVLNVFDEDGNLNNTPAQSVRDFGRLDETEFVSPRTFRLGCRLRF